MFGLLPLSFAPLFSFAVGLYFLSSSKYKCELIESVGWISPLVYFISVSSGE